MTLAPTMTLIDAMDDANLFGPLFNSRSWTAWKAFIAALFALPLHGRELAIYQRCTGRTSPPTKPFREAAMVIGRRGGKSRIVALIAVYLATFRSYAQFLAPGETPVVAVIAADRRQARVILRYALGFLRAVPLLAPLIARDDAESIELTNGVVVEVHTGRIASPRGRTYVAVLCDEIAYWRTDDDANNPDVEIINAVRPGLISIPGSVLLMCSSPYARRGLLWTTYRRHHAKDDGRVLVWQASTLAMNPLADEAVIAEAHDDDPIAAAAEYGAKFRSDIDSFISREVVDACTIQGRHELPPVSSTRYYAFTDPSGGGSDSFTLAIAHAEDRHGTSTAVLDAVREVRPPFSPDSVVGEFCTLLDSYGIATVTGDRYAGEWPRERFRSRGINYEPSQKSKSDLYIEALPLLNASRCELLDNSRLANQFVGLERRTGRGTGRDVIDHAPGAHDDVANVAAGVLVHVSASSSGLGVWERLATVGSPLVAPHLANLA